jgi:hypothetical protein
VNSLGLADAKYDGEEPYMDEEEWDQSDLDEWAQVLHEKYVVPICAFRHTDAIIVLGESGSFYRLLMKCSKFLVIPKRVLKGSCVAIQEN